MPSATDFDLDPRDQGIYGRRDIGVEGDFAVTGPMVFESARLMGTEKTINYLGTTRALRHGIQV